MIFFYCLLLYNIFSTSFSQEEQIHDFFHLLHIRSLTLSSDYLPIIVRLLMKTPSNPGLRRTYVNIKKANWDRYRQEVEATLSKLSLSTDCQRDEKIFRTVLFAELPGQSCHGSNGRA